jgi:hypothetical protein
MSWILFLFCCELALKLNKFNPLKIKDFGLPASGGQILFARSA